jgi:hypothetical protein
MKRARGPATTIAAGATATVTLYDGLEIGTATVTVTNPGPDIVPASRTLFLDQLDGIPGLSVIIWSCANDAG